MELFDRRWALLVLIIGLFTVSSGADAKMRINPAVHYRSAETKQGTGTSDSSVTLINLGLLYGDDTGFQLGALYAKQKLEASGSVGNGNSYGPSVGYKYKSVMFVVTYYVASEFTVGTSISKGTGLEADLAYLFKASGGVSFGLQMSYRQITYTKDESGDLAQELISSNIDPFILMSIEI